MLCPGRPSPDKRTFLSSPMYRKVQMASLQQCQLLTYPKKMTPSMQAVDMAGAAVAG